MSQCSLDLEGCTSFVNENEHDTHSRSLADNFFEGGCRRILSIGCGSMHVEEVMQKRNGELQFWGIDSLDSVNIHEPFREHYYWQEAGVRLFFDRHGFCEELTEHVKENKIDTYWFLFAQNKSMVDKYLEKLPSVPYIAIYGEPDRVSAVETWVKGWNASHPDDQYALVDHAHPVNYMVDTIFRLYRRKSAVQPTDNTTTTTETNRDSMILSESSDWPIWAASLGFASFVLFRLFRQST